MKPHLGCPLCEEERPYVNAGKVHIGYCEPCRVSWVIGTNLFSSWQDQTEEEQRDAYMAAGITRLRRIGAVPQTTPLADKLLGPPPGVIALEPF
jgi:hypothetical protein